MLGFSNQFLRLAYFRTNPSLFQYYNDDFMCTMGAYDKMSLAKCYLYLSHRSPSCNLCLTKIRKHQSQVENMLHNGKLSSEHFKYAPILELLSCWMEKSQPNISIEKPKDLLPKQSLNQRKEETKKTKHLLTEVTTSYQEETPTIDIPAEPKDLKYLYIDTCEECNTKGKKIVAWNMCWSCYYKWKHHLN